MQAKHKNPAQRKRTSAMQLELNNLRKTYLLPAPLLHRRGQGKPKTKPVSYTHLDVYKRQTP